MLAVELGKRLKEARIGAGYTQKQVAEKMGTVQTAYIKYELGKLELNYEKMVFLCRLYDVSSDYLLGITDESGRHANSGTSRSDSDSGAKSKIKDLSF